jgi:peptide-methionine (S)-S-oxide reductase
LDHAAAVAPPEGVISTRSGFMGGENDNPTEENNIGHAEVV